MQHQPHHLHHRLCRIWLEDEQLSEDLGALAAGYPVNSVSTKGQLHIAQLGLIPVVETTIEAKHAQATVQRRKRRTGLATMESWANRSPLLLLPLLADSTVPERPFLNLVLQLFSHARGLPLSLGSILGFRQEQQSGRTLKKSLQAQSIGLNLHCTIQF